MPKRDKAAGSYKWGSSHWKDTTWNKVHIAKAVYEYGVHIIHSDTDVTWFNDPLPYFHGEQWSKVHVAMATDALLTQNPVGDVGPELGTSPHWNINTGIYFFRQWPGGLDFYNAWLGWEPRNVGHDQDGFNYLVRGQWFHGDRDMPTAVLPAGTPWDNRYFWAAFSNTTAISFLPASSFGNAYTYVNARLYEKLKHPLYEVHWVWGGKTIESKRQNMRDAMKFHDPPEYYTEPNLISFDLEHMQPPDGYNSWPEPQTERMVRFHVEATNRQLAQAYWAFAAALVANRTLVMPKFLCYCSKNWYQTHACRVNNEPATTFPFVCALSQVMKVKALEQGLGLPGSTDYSGHRVFIREYSYLDNPKVPTRLKQSLLEVVTLEPRPAFVHDPAQLIRKIGPSPRGYGSQVVVHAPLSDVELRALFTLAPFREARVVHIAQPHKLFKGFTRPETQAQFDEEIQKKAAYWCCRTPVDMKAMNASDRMQLSLLPPERHGALPRLGPDSHAQYLQDLGPVVPRTEPVM
ncbi:hypothetical protein HYH03_002958 [Edaphochlamys debaryana]|uniref:Nucleotide-diphospho-sugar transferase domain-containing protein n=1 Tax=Edaphochlamys debaryana TaxID=47281 RepID=A0A835YB15_9CHLO|nr:hypothetical protein HYH03_002958 [Edaphochlamys debaryana]|eukprot:KAG2499383.1 hypothetical protein HYH03_002958 [Edaphochlamys debaryana]